MIPVPASVLNTIRLWSYILKFLLFETSKRNLAFLNFAMDYVQKELYVIFPHHVCVGIQKLIFTDISKNDRVTIMSELDIC